MPMLALGRRSGSGRRQAQEEEKMTSNRSFFHRLIGALGSFGSAARAARAVGDRHSPAPTDLERLGISVVAFGAINKN